MLIKLWHQFRQTICPKRLYRYGVNGLAYFDDRNVLEKVCDAVDNRIFNVQQEKRYEEARKTAHRREWTDKLGNTSEKIREAEKNGYAYASPREFEQVANKAKKRIEQEDRARFKKRIEFAVSEIKKGRKYTQEWGNTLAKLKAKG